MINIANARAITAKAPQAFETISQNLRYLDFIKKTPTYFHKQGFFIYYFI